MLRPMTARSLPTGTVTFLFSDMEGSTRLLQNLGPARFGDLLEQHNALLRAAFARHGGTERGTQGDSFLVMFPEAPAAVTAAAEAQAALARAEWPAATPVRVRMGLHTGVGTLGGDDYVSVDVNRAARVAGAAHGGQVILSDATRALTETALPPGTSLRSLGEHRLKDLPTPEHLHQLIVEGLPSEFPPPLTLGRATGDLPARVTSFIGREAELEELASLLADNRLVTLTGPGGTGKTSLALELARQQAIDFMHGAWYVPLESVDEPGLVGAATAARLGLVESAGASAIERLGGFLRDREILLVLDNFEHLLDAAPLVAELLAGSPGLRVVVTSRAALRIAAEQEFPVRPLGVPDEAASSASQPGGDAVQLFLERARRVRPGYEPSADDLDAIGDIVRRLDGLPLGVELAASRVALLAPRQIADRLARQLDLPGGGGRDQPERQRTMAGAITWSHDLLSGPERRLLARLSVFVGDFGLDEAEVVCGPAAALGMDVFDGLAKLVEHSLLIAQPSLLGARFRLLDTVRMFAAERLDELAETTALRDRHVAAYLAIAERVAPGLPGPDQRGLLEGLTPDHANFRAAVAWAIESGNLDGASRLIRSLWRYWQMRGHLQEGQAFADAVLAMPAPDEPTVGRVRLLDAAGGLAYWGNDLETAHSRYLAQIEAARQLGDPAELANALYNGSFTARIARNDWNLTEAMQAEAADLYHKVGDERGPTRLEWSKATNLFTQGRLEETDEILRNLYDRFRELGDIYYLSLVTDTRSWVALATNRPLEALAWSARALMTYRALGDVAGRTLGLAGVAVMLLGVDLVREAAIVRSAYDALSDRYFVRPPVLLDQIVGPNWAPAKLTARLSPDELADATRLGAQMTLEEVVDFVVGVVEGRLGELETPLDAPTDA
jgi:predicted ATPase/class 3 adenylate cyclase